MRCVVLCCVQAVALAKGFAAKGVPRNRRTIGVLKVRPALYPVLQRVGPCCDVLCCVAGGRSGVLKTEMARRALAKL